MQFARLAALLGIASASCFAGRWSGALVDAKCYAAEERNVNPTDTEANVDRDRSSEIRYCAPSAETKSFALILSDSQSIPLDSAGNQKATELIRGARKKAALAVMIMGQSNGRVLQVDSIVAAPER